MTLLPIRLAAKKASGCWIIFIVMQSNNFAAHTKLVQKYEYYTNQARGSPTSQPAT